MHDFANTKTGAGPQENDEGTFKDAIMKIYKIYFDIFDVMVNCASAQVPLRTIATLYPLLTLTAWTIPTKKKEDLDNSDKEIDNNNNDNSANSGYLLDLDNSNKEKEDLDNSDKEIDNNNNDNSANSGCLLEADANNTHCNDGNHGSAATSSVSHTKSISKNKKTKKGKPYSKSGKLDVGIGFSVACLKHMKSKELSEMKCHHLNMEKIESKH